MILGNDGIEEETIEFPVSKPEPKREPDYKPLPQSPQETRVSKRQVIEEFNNKPETKQYGVKLISKKTLASMWIVIGLLILLFSINMVWSNVNTGKLANKDFSFNSNPQIDNNYTNEFNHTTVNHNNYTIVNNNTIILPDELLIKLQNSTN